MHVGHFAVGMVAKRVEPRISLGTAVFAAMLADILWCVFWMTGVEQVSYKFGHGAANYLVPIEVSWSHSLLMDVVWSALMAGAFYWRRRCPRGAVVLAGVVLSHWVLDWIAWNPSTLPLAPGARLYSGLGLWTSVPADIAIEGGFWLLAIVLYLRATRPANRAGIYIFWIVAAFLTLAWYNNIAGPPPPNPHAAPLSSAIYFTLVVAWAYWMNRLRPALCGPPISSVTDAPHDR
jgi:hypothetical protein